MTDTATRSNYLSELDCFINDKSKKIDEYLSRFSWNIDDVFATSSNDEKDLVMAVCPLDNSHVVPHDKLETHITRCLWKQGGYHEDDTPLPECTEGGGFTVTLTQDLQADIILRAAAQDTSIERLPYGATPEVPLSASRLVATLTPQQRLALYQYVVKKTSTDNESHGFTEHDLNFEMANNKPERPKSFLETLAEERNAKRRRLNYRNAKKVHTRNKSQSEILREVIESQMGMYEQWLKTGKLPSEESNNFEAEIKTENVQQQESLQTSQKKQDIDISYRTVDSKRHFGYNQNHQQDQGSFSSEREFPNRPERRMLENTAARLKVEHRDSHVERRQEKSTSRKERGRFADFRSKDVGYQLSANQEYGESSYKVKKYKEHQDSFERGMGYNRSDRKFEEDKSYEKGHKRSKSSKSSKKRHRSKSPEYESKKHSYKAKHHKKDKKY